MSYLYGGGNPYGGMYAPQFAPQYGMGGYGGGYGLNPYAAMQQMQQQYQAMQPQAPQMSPNQQMAAQYSHGGVGGNPFNDPRSGMRGPGPDYNRMPQQAMPQGQPYPSVGLSDVVRQMQGGMSPNLAQFNLGRVAGLPMPGQAPQMGQWSSQGQAPQPFSPIRNEGYVNQPQMPRPVMPNQFTAQNQTRGMSGGPISNPFRAASPMAPHQGHGGLAGGGLPADVMNRIGGLSGPDNRSQAEKDFFSNEWKRPAGNMGAAGVPFI